MIICLLVFPTHWQYVFGEEAEISKSILALVLAGGHLFPVARFDSHFEAADCAELLNRNAIVLQCVEKFFC